MEIDTLIANILLFLLYGHPMQQGRPLYFRPVVSFSFFLLLLTAALWNRAGHYIFAVISSIFFFFFYLSIFFLA